MPIEKAARKCPHCQTSQRHIPVAEASAVISAIAAAVSVSAAGWPALRAALAPPYAKPQFQILNNSLATSAEGQWVVAVENKGARPAYIWGMGASVERLNRHLFELPIEYEFEMRPRSFEDAVTHMIVVPANGSTTFFATIKTYHPIVDDIGDVTCNADIVFYGGNTDYSFKNTSVKNVIDCGHSLPVLAALGYDKLAKVLRGTGQTTMADRVENDAKEYRRRFPTLRPGTSN